MTALPMMIAEELQCDWSKVRIEYASPNRNIRENNVYGDMFSNGSRSVRASQKQVQQVGASARERLIAAAAARWNVPASECTAAISVVTHTAVGPHPALRRTRRRRGEDHARQGAGDQDAGAVHLHPQADAAGRRRRTRPTARPSSASTRRSPAWCSPRSWPARSRAASSRASMTRCSTARRASLQVVKLPNAVAVVATGTFWRAKRALSRLQPEWDVGAAGTVDSEQLSQRISARRSTSRC